MSSAVMRYSFSVVTSPGKIFKFTPTVSLVRCVSAFCGLILSVIIPKVTVLTSSTLYLLTKRMMFVPDGILVPTPCASQPISFANDFFQMDLVGPSLDAYILVMPQLLAE